MHVVGFQCQAHAHKQRGEAITAQCLHMNRLKLAKPQLKPKLRRMHMHNKGTGGWWVADLMS